MPASGAATFWMSPTAHGESLRLRRAPLFAAAIAFALGEQLTHFWQTAGTLLAALALLLLLSLLALRRSPRIAPVPVLALWIVAGLWCAQIQPTPPQQTQLRTLADGLSRTVRGRITRIRQLPSPTTPTTNPDNLKPWQLEPGAWLSEGISPTASIDLAIDEVEVVTPDIAYMQPIHGGARITLLDAALPLHCGDAIQLPLRLREPELYRDPGAWSYADQLLQEGISVQASAKATNLTFLTTKTPSTPPHFLHPQTWTASSLHCQLNAAQSWASAHMNALVASHANYLLPAAARLTTEDASMLNAMLFGDRSGLHHDLRLGFERTGSFHLFVVSGMHVALLAGLVFWLLRRARAPHGLATPATIALTTAYAALTGFGIPVQRALLMATIFLVARWMWRDINILQAIGAAALTVLILSPHALTEASFQMTFLALIAVGGLAIPLAEPFLLPHIRATRNLDAVYLDAQLYPHLAQLRLILRLFGTAFAAAIPKPFNRYARHLPAISLRLLLRTLELTLVGLVVEACMALPMAIYFHRATPFALPANLLAVPLVAVLAPLAILTFCAALLSPWLAILPAAATALTLHAIRHAIAFLSHARLADTRVPAPATAAIFLAITALAFALWAVRRRDHWFLTTGIAALAIIPLAALYPAAPIIHPNTLEVTALDVGQGDSLLVVSPDGHTLLVDAGGPTGIAAHAETASTANTRWDVGEEVVAPFLWSRRLRRLDAVVLTHAHSDHMGGLPAILRDFHPRELWLSIDPPDSPDFHALLALAADLHITLRHFHAGNAFPWGGTQATVLSPEAQYQNARGTPVNDDSLVLRLDYGQSSVLLEGDAERPSEDAMLANHRLAPVTLLKVGHHGSKTSTNPDFLAAVTPREAVISSGRRNTFGHPRYEILERLAATHIQTWRTDREGATTFLLTPDGHITAASAGP